MTDSRRTIDVVVHKAAVPLMKGESLGAFTAELRKQGDLILRTKFNMGDKKGSTWPVEVFSNKAVFKVIPDYDKPPSNDFYVAVKFSRDNGGKFNFTETMKVTPMMNYVPAAGQMSVTKDAEGGDQPELPVGVKKAMEMDNWAQGGVFAGVL